MMNKSDANKRFDAMKQDGATWLSTWKEIQPYIAPHRGYFSDTPNQGSRLDHKTLINSVAVRSLGILAAGMTSGLTSPSRPWFKLGLPDESLMSYEPVKYWLEDVESRLLTIFSKAKIYGNLTSIYEEIGAFGTGAMMVVADYETVIRGRHFTAGEFYIDQDGDNRVNSLARPFSMNVGQLVKTYGLENCSQMVQDAHKRGECSKWVKLRHLVAPNPDYNAAKMNAAAMKYISLTWEENGNDGKILRTGGYNSFPFMAPRWGLSRPADAYGRSSPGWMTLGDTKMLQKMEKDYLTALALVNKPPMIKDGNVAGSVNIVPGGVTVSSNMAPNAGARPAYQINPDLSAMDAKITRVENAIRSGFFADLFLMLATQDNPQMTAREVVERHEEKLLVLGPLLESLEGELLDPLIDRTFELALEAGAIPPPPKELQGLDLKVEYISPLAQAQKMVGTTAIEQGFRFLGNVAAVAPETMDVVDADEAVRQHMKMDGVSPKIIRSKEATAEIRQVRAAQKEQELALQNAQALAAGAKTLADTKVGQNSALDAVLAGIQGGTVPQ